MDDSEHNARAIKDAGEVANFAYFCSFFHVCDFFPRKGSWGFWPTFNFLIFLRSLPSLKYVFVFFIFCVSFVIHFLIFLKKF